jgi:hypothetical protein
MMPRTRAEAWLAVREFAVLTLGIIAVWLWAWALAPLQPASAQTPDQVIQITQQRGGQFAPCLLQIEARETGNTYLPNLVNPSSGAYGPLQYLQRGGVWDATPLGRSGVPVTAASVEQQVDMATWAMQAGYKSAWSPSPC